MFDLARRCFRDGRLGDAVEQALSAAGITGDRVRAWFGDCGCEERKEKLNALGVWAVGYIKGKRTSSDLDRFMGADQ